jgi:hypothetical protein
MIGGARSDVSRPDWRQTQRVELCPVRVGGEWQLMDVKATFVRSVGKHSSATIGLSPATAIG